MPLIATTLHVSPARARLIEAVKAHALEHYNDGGWDVIVECWDDEQILECIAKCRTAAGAIAKVGEIVDVYAERQADARISAGESD